MSLKNVHLIFIVAATLLALLCALLAFGRFQDGGSPLMAAASACAVLAAAVLAAYEARFVRRCRAEGIR